MVSYAIQFIPVSKYWRYGWESLELKLLKKALSAFTQKKTPRLRTIAGMETVEEIQSVAIGSTPRKIGVRTETLHYNKRTQRDRTDMDITLQWLRPDIEWGKLRFREKWVEQERSMNMKASEGFGHRTVPVLRVNEWNTKRALIRWYFGTFQRYHESTTQRKW